MKKTVFISLTTLCLCGLAVAQPYSIYEIQYTAAPDGNSPMQGQIIDCLGGIVTHKFLGFRPRLIIQDPGFPLGWGAIQVKDWLPGYPLYNKASIGDWVTLSNVEVEEYDGSGTILQCYLSNNPNLTVISSHNPLPEPLLIDVNEISAPVYDDARDGWFVTNRRAEKYESMWVTIKNVVVMEKGNGKASDNYTLQSVTEPNDSNFSCWAADYMNEEVEADDYHRFIELDRRFCSVTGIIEHYSGYKNYYEWDYYQLITTKTDDFLISQIGDFDDDCDVDFADFGQFAQYWLVACNLDPNLCGQADLIEDSIVDEYDLAEFAYYWLDGVN